ncbi:MAG: preprotein translocase subunit SecE [Pseudomonadota bacterium]
MAKSKKSGGGDTIEGKAVETSKKKKRTNIFAFFQQVRNEGAKVTWTTRNETLVSSIMVLIMVAIMALFFFLVDQVLRFGVCNVLPIQCVALGN